MFQGKDGTVINHIRAEVERVGFALMKSATPDKTDEILKERAIGYGNQGYLVVFPYNTPSQTVTALWAEGTVDGRPWKPLVARLKKK